MDFVGTSQREALRATVRAWLDDTCSTAQLRTLMESDRGVDDTAWARLATGIGAPGLLVDSAYGGGGGDFADVAVVLEEMGRAVYCGPYLSTAALGAPALNASDDEGLRARFLPPLVRGELFATVAMPAGRLGGTGIRADAGANPEVRLSGTLDLVLDGHLADVLVVPAHAGEQPGLFVVTSTASGLRRQQLPSMDQTRRLARVDLDQTPGVPLVTGPAAATELMRRLGALSWVALACEQVGGTERCVELSSDYARSRMQFGVPIGTFQAVKHMCADMLTAAELARSTATQAVWCVDHEPTELEVAARVATSLCSETYLRAAADTIQIHGGLGFTWDHPAHLYFKRAKSSELMFGQPAEHREALARVLGIEAAGADSTDGADSTADGGGLTSWPY